jgi:hypothetical protein
MTSLNARQVLSGALLATPVSTSVTEWFKSPLPQQPTAEGFVEGLMNAATELLIAVGLVLFVVGTPFLFLAGAIYLDSLVGPEGLPDLGQFYGP